MLVAHKRPDGEPCNVPGKAGSDCLHCGTAIPHKPPVPNVIDEPTEPVAKVMTDAEKIEVEIVAKVTALVRKHMKIEDLVTLMADEYDCQLGSITIEETRRMVILPAGQ